MFLRKFEPKPKVIKTHKTYDFLVIGGGIFGVYAALYLDAKGYKVGIVEKEEQLLKKASIVNQARLHAGYHYPRSVATARMSDDHRERFTREHKDFILFSFEKYYAIDKYASLTDARQFERFCQYIGLRCEPVHDHPLFNYKRLEALYLTTEYTFDPILVAKYYQQRLRERPKIEVMLNSRVVDPVDVGGSWLMSIDQLHDGTQTKVKASAVINATYAGSNSVNRLFGLDEIQLMHEISEIAFVTSPQLSNIGLTVMDGQFGSIMPYGKSGLLSLSSVAYTHHKVCYENLPTFECQQHAPNCRPDFPGNCNFCPAKPASNHRKMISQMLLYFSDRVSMHYFTSFFTIKSKLKANFIDDGRPTEINKLHSQPDFYCIFAGKINSIYEVEKIL